MKKWIMFSVLALAVFGSLWAQGVWVSGGGPATTEAWVTQGDPHAFSFMTIGRSSYLGVQLADLDQDDMTRLGLNSDLGVRIAEVVSGSPAEEAGLAEDDVVVAYAGIPVLGAQNLQRLVGETPAGRTVPIEIVRNGKKTTVSAKVAEPPQRERMFSMRPGPEGPFRMEIPPIEIAPGDRDIVVVRGKPRLGIQAQPLTGQLARFFGVEEGKGLLVSEVLEGSPAEKAGLLAGDVIVAVDGQTVVEVPDLSRRLDEGRHEIEVVRDGKAQTLSVEIPKDQQDRRGVREGVRL